MFPAKLRALNQDSEEDDSEDNEHENKSSTITKEALEQKAQIKYRQALLLQNDKKQAEAEISLCELLESELMQSVQGKVKYIGDRLQPSMAHLKYCILVNLANIKIEKSDFRLALEYLLQAVELDDTNLSVWYRLGSVAMKVTDLNLAVSAFIQGLSCSPTHWPSIDKLITALYAVQDFMTCLMYISEALRLDSTYLKGVAFKETILREHPTLKDDFVALYPQLDLRTNITDYDKDKAINIFAEAERLRKSDPYLQAPLHEEEETLILGLLKPLPNYSWISIGRCLIKLYRFALYHGEEVLSAYIDLKKTAAELYELGLKNLKEENDQAGLKMIAQIEEALAEQIAEKDRSSSMSFQSSDSEAEHTSENATRSKKRKGSPTLAEQLRMVDKRRSARNRTSVKNNEQSLAKMLRNLIPFKLPQKDNIYKGDFADPSRWYEDSADTMDIFSFFESQEFLAETTLPTHPRNSFSEESRTKLLQEEGYFGSALEITDIELFIETCTKRVILNIMEVYLRKLASKWTYIWPLGLSNIYVEIYQILVCHSTFGRRIKGIEQYQMSNIVDEQAMDHIKNDVLCTLLYGELLLNDWFENNAENVPQNYRLLRDKFNPLLLGDLNDACILLKAEETDVKLWMRCFWLEALLYVQQHDATTASLPLTTLINNMPIMEIEVRLPNMKHFYSISQTSAQRLLNTLIRNQDLDRAEPLFLENQYKDVVEILTKTLWPDCNQSFTLPDSMTLSRHQQYSFLLASLWELKDFKSFVWCEVACYEAFAMYRKCFFDDSEADEKSKWASLVMNTLHGMLSCVVEDTSVTLSENNVFRLVQTLCNLVCHQVESSEQIPEIIVDVVTPWILLFHLVDYEEQGKNLNVSSESVELTIPSSFSVLFLAHEQLGRRCWCCFDDGLLLFYMLDMLEPLYKRFDIDTESWATISLHIDQIFYCLYAHPFKKSKSRHMQEHNSLGLALTWNRAVRMYQFYKPKELPLYDNVSKVHSISADIESLLMRMMALIPPEQNPARLMDSAMQYVNGEIELMPENDNPLQQEASDLFYLLGDYYFQNKVWSKALRYYLLDVCTNPYRIDSWAAMALARGSQLEMKLNSCETIKNESDILKRADITSQCFKTALDLDSTQAKLWIEHGVFCYSVHAFCSRLLKQETTKISLQMFEMLEGHKEKFLKTAFNCFSTINEIWPELSGKDEDIQDERWLHYYMLGKISEKREEKPEIYLNHYFKASQLLNINGAQYPQRIIYATPQYYSVEALEVHYRVHATILKMLEMHEEKAMNNSILEVVQEIIDKFSNSPFALAKQKMKKITKKEKQRVKAIQDNVEKNVAEDLSKNSENGTKRKVSSEQAEHIGMAEKKIKIEEAERITPEVPHNDEVSFVELDDDCIIVDDPLHDPLAIDEDQHSETNPEHISPLKLECVSEVDISNITKVNISAIISEDDPDQKNPKSSSQTTHLSGISSSSDSQDSDTSDSEDENKSVSTRIKKMEIEGTENIWDKVRILLARKCLFALEDCSRRFPEHYKSLYRLANHYFKSKHDKDLRKVRELMLCPGGLFADRKFSNFFNEVWRIPTAEIDRPGSFAYHMGRCVHLLMDVLRASEDYKMLLTVSIQLKDMPDADKKYLRDNEREQLSQETLPLCAQVLRKCIEEAVSSNDQDTLLKLLIETNKCYLRVTKYYPNKEQLFSKLLRYIYNKYVGVKEKIPMEQIVYNCKQLSIDIQGNTTSSDIFDKLKTATIRPILSKPKDSSDSTQVRNSLEVSEIKTAIDMPAKIRSECKPKSAHVATSEIPIKETASVSAAPISGNKLAPILPSARESTKTGSKLSSKDHNINIPSNVKAYKEKHPVPSSSTGSYKNRLVNTLPSSSNPVMAYSRPNVVITQVMPKSKTCTPMLPQLPSTLQIHPVRSPKLPAFTNKPISTNVRPITSVAASKSFSTFKPFEPPVVKYSPSQIAKSAVLNTAERILVPPPKVAHPHSIPSAGKTALTIGKERPSLIITPVTSSSKCVSQTLQQKLAVKQSLNAKQNQTMKPLSSFVPPTIRYSTVPNKEMPAGKSNLSICKVGGKLERPVPIPHQGSGITIRPVVSNATSSSQLPTKHSVSIRKVNPGSGSESASSTTISQDPNFKYPQTLKTVDVSNISHLRELKKHLTGQYGSSVDKSKDT